MPSLDDLARAFEEAGRSRWNGVTEQLSHVDMINLADTLTGWAMARGISREWSGRLLGWAETMQQMADKVGPSWSRPEPRSFFYRPLAANPGIVSVWELTTGTLKRNS